MIARSSPVGIDTATDESVDGELVVARWLPDVSHGRSEGSRGIHIVAGVTDPAEDHLAQHRAEIRTVRRADGPPEAFGQLDERVAGAVLTEAAVSRRQASSELLVGLRWPRSAHNRR